MIRPAYTTIAIVPCEAGFLPEARGYLAEIAGALTGSGAALSARFGQILTGTDAGQVVFFTSYADLDAVGRGLEVIRDSDGHAALNSSGKVGLARRDLLHLEDVLLPEPPKSEPTVGVITRFRSPTSYVAEMQSLLPIFHETGAQVTRFGTVMAGVGVGERMMAVAYPSMAAVDATYAALATSPSFQAASKGTEVTAREIFRFLG